MNQNMGTCLVVITKHRNYETAKLQFDSKNLRNTEICQSPSVDSHFDPSVRQVGLNGSQILFLPLCFSFKCRQMYHAPTDCATIRKWLTKCADDSETANYISAHTKDVRVTQEQSTTSRLYSHCYFCPILCVDVESKPGSRIWSIHTIGSCSNLVWIEVSISAMVVVSSHFWARQQLLCRSVMAGQEFKAWNMTQLCRLRSCSKRVTCVTSALQNSDVDTPLPKVWM